MTDYMEYLKLPETAVVVIIAVLLFTNVVGEILELKGKTVSEFVKFRKFFQRKRKERKTLREMPAVMAKVEKTLNEINAHYDADNISKRNAWMRGVDAQQEKDHAWIAKLDEALAGIKADLLSMRIEDMRSEIISFASYVADGKNPVTREQFNRIFKMYARYEAILEENEMTNGETNTAMQIIRESYEHHMRGHTFIEDIRGYADAK